MEKMEEFVYKVPARGEGVGPCSAWKEVEHCTFINTLNTRFAHKLCYQSLSFLEWR